MRDISPELLPGILRYRLPGLDFGPNAVHPNYSGTSIANIPDSICTWLGIPSAGDNPLERAYFDAVRGSFRKVILILVDGLGLSFLQKILSMENQTETVSHPWSRILDGQVLAPLTSIAPSTTSAALTTLWTGRTAVEHGIVGYEVWLKEFGMISNMIFQSPASYQNDIGSLNRAGFMPESFLPIATLGPHFCEHGVKPYAFLHASIARSGLSLMHFPAVDVFSYRSVSDLWVTLRELIAAKTRERAYYYVYWGELDTLAHRFGPENERVLLELDSFAYQFANFIDELKRTADNDTLVLLTADHGQLSTPIKPEFDLRKHTEMMDCLVMNPSGESRLSFLYVRPGKENRLLRYIEETWPGMFTVYPTEQLLAGGLFGPPESAYMKVRDRLGDFVAISQGAGYWWWAQKANSLLGRHGGLDPREMLVPLMAIRL